jgi:ribonuclease G
VKLYTPSQPILEKYGVQAEIDKAVRPRVWLRSGGYIVINQTEALVAIDVNTGKFVGRGSGRLEDTITRTNLEAVEEIVRQIRLRDLGGIIVLDLIDMEERRNRTKVMQVLQDALRGDKSPTKVLSFNDFGLVIMTRKRVKQSLERTLCAPCQYCQGAGLIKSPQTICY